MPVTNTEARAALRQYRAAKADRAGETLAHYSGLDTSDPVTSATDLISDLMHLIEREGGEPELAPQGAAMHFRQEGGNGHQPDDISVASALEDFGGRDPDHDGRPVVVVLRDPDYSSDFDTFPGTGDPLVISVDRGASFDGSTDDPDTWREFAEGVWTSEAASLPADHPAREVVAQYVNGAWNDDAGDPPLPWSDDEIADAVRRAVNAMWASIGAQFPNVPGDHMPGDEDAKLPRLAGEILRRWLAGKDRGARPGADGFRPADEPSHDRGEHEHMTVAELIAQLETLDPAHEIGIHSNSEDHDVDWISGVALVYQDSVILTTLDEDDE